MPADPYAIAKKFSKFLRVTDVADGLDAVGRGDMTLMDRTIRPLWMGVRFFGPAVTLRVLPTNRPMPQKISREDALRQHGIWHDMGGFAAKVEDHVKQGSVIVCSTGGARECGFFGSNNTLALEAQGAAGIVTEGYCRDTDEVILQQGPVACAGIGRTIIPGRVEVVDVETPISCGGAMVRPGDIVGCDWDGCLVVPRDVAEDVLYFAAKIAIDDKKARRRLYEKLGKPMDETVDWEAAEAWFKDIL